MPAESQRVFTIPPGCPFLPTLVDALCGGSLLPDVGGDPAALAAATIYLPTRRAARALAALLAERADGRTLLLPRIVPLGEAEPLDIDAALVAADGTVLQPEIPPLARRLVLTELVQRWAKAVDGASLGHDPGMPFLVPSSPADAVALAGDLEALMDSFTTEGVPWSNLELAVEAEYSRYFEFTRTFVGIAAERWPEYLAERGASDPAGRRDAVTRAEADRLRQEQPAAPVVAAGSTGSIPATAELLAAIARLPRGAVVLPGLDVDLDEDSFAAIGGGEGKPRDRDDGTVFGHPQANLQRLLARHLLVRRSDVVSLGLEGPAARARRRVVSQALRPAQTTDRWAEDPLFRLAESADGCAGIALVAAADEREEALAIAIALRETLEVPGRTAALVTPDRALATRVVAELGRWGVEVEDSAGVGLNETAMGRLARLAADAAADDFHPVRLLALLAAPQVRVGLAAEEMRRARAALELGVLRGPVPPRGLAGLAAACEDTRGRGGGSRRARPARRLGPGDAALARRLVRRLTGAFGSFTAAAHGETETDLRSLVDGHRRAVEALIARPRGEPVLHEEDGSAEALESFFGDLADTAARPVAGRFSDYPAFFATLARLTTLSPPPRATHRRLKILGLLEARLVTVDRLVLGGLDEGLWPPAAETDAFLNRPMRAAVGLSPPERRIGQTAHDFAQALGTPDVVVSRALKRGGKPMVPSRFLQRLKAFVHASVWELMMAAGTAYCRLARTLDRAADKQRPIARPQPNPGGAYFPRALSVTDIETLVRDPYAIYARQILGLDALDPLAKTPGAAERGILVHATLGQFATDHPTTLPAGAYEVLLQLGESRFAALADTNPELHAEWWRRFQRLAARYVEWEHGRRARPLRIAAECRGELAMTLADGSAFALRARADRIEMRADGSRAVVDFKTGTLPGQGEIAVGFSPQLTLEAAMVMAGAFEDVAASPSVPELLYVQVSGGRVSLTPMPVNPPKGVALGAMIDEHRERFTALFGSYAAGERPYISRPYPKYARRFSDYDHLARVKEWALATDDDEGAP